MTSLREELRHWEQTCAERRRAEEKAAHKSIYNKKVARRVRGGNKAKRRF